MINFNYEFDFALMLKDEILLSKWISNAIIFEGFIEGDLNYIFCGDDYLHELNKNYLNHDTLTDIISFDYTDRKLIQGDMYISIERVLDNSKQYNVDFYEELRRVMIHGILHYCGYKDKNDDDMRAMRMKEDFYLRKYNETI